MDQFYRIQTTNEKGQELLNVGVSDFKTLLDVLAVEARQLTGTHAGTSERTRVLFITLEHIPVAEMEIDIKEGA